ncbi:hypothetical protein O0I10_005115 [Lichtheimia ornata]|uniref:Uncharacterized protein n=1 Tax=Lichtheimia ornata TaxID=688661 RepID=A0AAD7Y1R4_9FUNG|nr:uncharacterized protein O0I10_005115 [Lichtheimia ornata]KAJ8659077.1 hypothetical protein O0I10_005115 [Lichtheimia ornata]
MHSNKTFPLFALFLLWSSALVYAQEEESAQDECAAVPKDEYNLGLRIGSIFIIMAATLVGVFTPILLHRISPYSKNSIRYWVLTVAKFFGTGVILSVAFVHVMPEATERFESPCITSGSWHNYEGFVGVFALIAVFFVQLIELAAFAHLERTKSSSSSSETTAKEADLEVGVDQHVHTPLDKNINTIVLEIGIVIHSVIIGLTLGFSSSDGFNALLIALVFHQFFEGIALGTRINEMDFRSAIKPLLMGLVFAFTTPVGVAIGIGVNVSINPNSAPSILAQAILDSLAAGILLYNAFISLISSEMTHNLGFRNSSFANKLTCLMSMYIGAALMSLLGYWA